MLSVSRRVRRFALTNGLRPTDDLDVPVLGRRWRPQSRDRLVCAFHGNWRGAAITVAALKDLTGEDAQHYICAETGLGVGLEPTALGHRWLVRGDLLGRPLSTGAPPLPAPRTLREHAAYHETIEVRSLDERWGPVIASSTLVDWFQRTDRHALAFEIPRPRTLVAVGGPGEWERDVEGFIDALLEFRDTLMDVLHGLPGGPPTAGAASDPL